MAFSVLEGIRYNIMMAEAKDFLHASFALMPDGLQRPFLYIDAFWLQSRDAYSIVAVRFCNAPVHALVRSITARREYQRKAGREFGAKPCFASHDMRNIFQSRMVPLGTNHRIVTLFKLFFASFRLVVAGGTERDQIADGIPAVFSARHDVMDFETTVAFPTFPAPASVTQDCCFPKVFVQAVRLLVLPAIRLIVVRQGTDVDGDILQIETVDADEPQKVVRDTEYGLPLLLDGRSKPSRFAGISAIVKTRRPMPLPVTMIPTIFSADRHLLADIASMLHRGLQQYFVPRLALLHEGDADMFRAIIDSHAHFVAVFIFNNFLELDGHGILADENGFLLPDEPPCVLHDGRIQSLAVRVKHE